MWLKLSLTYSENVVKISRAFSKMRKFFRGIVFLTHRVHTTHAYCWISGI